MYYTDDPDRDFLHHDAAQQRELERLPVCDECGEPIQDEYCYEVDGRLICDDCMAGHRKAVDDMIA